MGHKFEKGKTINPGGRPSLSSELKAVKECTDQELKRIIAKHLRYTVPESLAASESTTIPIVEVIIARALYDTAMNGKIQTIYPLFDRAAGKVKEIVQHEGVSENAPQVIVYLPDNGRRAGVIEETAQSSDDEEDEIATTD